MSTIIFFACSFSCFFFLFNCWYSQVSTDFLDHFLVVASHEAAGLARRRMKIMLSISQFYC
ncbi:MAG: hypothetical protein JSV88_12070, partial [Candidatus Aminicenantes bacterium]